MAAIFVSFYVQKHCLLELYTFPSPAAKHHCRTKQRVSLASLANYEIAHRPFCYYIYIWLWGSTDNVFQVGSSSKISQRLWKLKWGKHTPSQSRHILFLFGKNTQAKNLIPTSQRRHFISITKKNHLVLFGGNNHWLFWKSFETDKYTLYENSDVTM